jgi:hypothetical protein
MGFTGDFPWEYIECIYIYIFYNIGKHEPEDIAWDFF